MWVRHILDSLVRWRAQVATLFFADSVCDRPASTGGNERDASRVASTAQCDTCGAAFASARALSSHCRIKHGTRAPQLEFLTNDGTCQVCGTRFGSVLRLQAHLSDPRAGRNHCWHAILARPRAYRRCSDSELVANVRQVNLVPLAHDFSSAKLMLDISMALSSPKPILLRRSRIDFAQYNTKIGSKPIKGQNRSCLPFPML